MIIYYIACKLAGAAKFKHNIILLLCIVLQYVDGTELQHANSKEILFGAMSGVNHLHTLKISELY